MSENRGDLVIAVDIGGGSVKLALTNSEADELAAEVIDGVPNFDGETLLGMIGRGAESLRELGRARSGHLVGLAIGVPGHLSLDRRASLNSNVPALDGIDLVGYFGDWLSCRVELENDANLAALGEWSFGPWNAAARFMMVTLGTGIGVALLDRGVPVGVVGGTLGDIGHIIVDPAAVRACRLGCRGCLESVASGLALTDQAEALSDRMPNSALGALRRRQRAITGGDLGRLAASGDEATLSLLAEIARWLGMGLATYINTFAPDVICIGGGMSRLRPFIEDALLASANEGKIKNRPGTEAIYFSNDYDQAAARGAATLFFRNQGLPHA